jgi:hypothetical protein
MKDALLELGLKEHGPIGLRTIFDVMQHQPEFPIVADRFSGSVPWQDVRNALATPEVRLMEVLAFLETSPKHVYELWDVVLGARPFSHFESGLDHVVNVSEGYRVALRPVLVSKQDRRVTALSNQSRRRGKSAAVHFIASEGRKADP